MSTPTSAMMFCAIRAPTPGISARRPTVLSLGWSGPAMTTGTLVGVTGASSRCGGGGGNVLTSSVLPLNSRDLTRAAGSASGVCVS